MKKLLLSLLIVSLIAQASSPDDGYHSISSESSSPEFSSPLILTNEQIVDFQLNLDLIDPLSIGNDTIREELIKAMEVALYEQQPINFLDILLIDQTGYGSSNFYKQWITTYYYQTTPVESLSFESFAENNPDFFAYFVERFSAKTTDFLDYFNTRFISAPYKTLYETIQLLRNEQAKINHGSIDLVQRLLEDDLITEDALTYIALLIRSNKITAQDLLDHPESIKNSFLNKKAFESDLAVLFLSQLEPEKAVLLIKNNKFLVHKILSHFKYFKEHLPVFVSALQQFFFQALTIELVTHNNYGSFTWLKAFPHTFDLNLLVPQDYEGMPIKGFTLLELAFLQNNFTAFQTFLAYGANPNLPNGYGFTPLKAMLFSCWDVPNPLRFFFTLLDYGAHLTEEDALTLKEFATELQKQKINEYLENDFNTIPTKLKEPFELVTIQ